MKAFEYFPQIDDIKSHQTLIVMFYLSTYLIFQRYTKVD